MPRFDAATKHRVSSPADETGEHLQAQHRGIQRMSQENFLEEPALDDRWLTLALLPFGREPQQAVFPVRTNDAAMVARPVSFGQGNGCA